MRRWHQQINRREWAVVRYAALVRDGWRCRKCGRPGRLEVDHIKPLSEYSEDDDPMDLDGLQTLCRFCHFAKTSLENRSTPGPERVAWNNYLGV